MVAMENTSKGYEITRVQPPGNSRGLFTVSSTISQSSICRINCAQFSSLGVGGTRCDGIKWDFFPSSWTITFRVSLDTIECLRRHSRLLPYTRDGDGGTHLPSGTTFPSLCLLTQPGWHGLPPPPFAPSQVSGGVEGGNSLPAGYRALGWAFFTGERHHQRLISRVRSGFFASLRASVKTTRR